MHRVWNMCCFGRKKPFNIKRALIWNRRYNNVAWCEIKWNAASLGIYQIYDILYRIDVLYKTVALEYRGEKYMNNSIKSRKIICFYPNMLWPFFKITNNGALIAGYFKEFIAMKRISATVFPSSLLDHFPRNWHFKIILF